MQPLVLPPGSCAGQPPIVILLLCRESNDFLLPAVITFLNSRDWQLRAAFFRHISAMGASANTEGMEVFLLPCLEQVRLMPPAQPQCCIWLLACVRGLCRSQMKAGHWPSGCLDTVCVPPTLRLWRCPCCPAWSRQAPCKRETTCLVRQRSVQPFLQERDEHVQHLGSQGLLDGLSGAGESCMEQ